MNGNTVALDSRSRFRRMVDRVFPVTPLPAPPDEPGYAESYIVIETVTVFGLADRVRIMVSGRVRTTCYVKTNVIVETAKTTGVTSVLPPARAVNRHRRM